MSLRHVFAVAAVVFLVAAVALLVAPWIYYPCRSLYRRVRRSGLLREIRRARGRPASTIEQRKRVAHARAERMAERPLSRKQARKIMRRRGQKILKSIDHSRRTA